MRNSKRRFPLLLLGLPLALAGAHGLAGPLLADLSALWRLIPDGDWPVLFDRDLFSVLFWPLFAIMNPFAAIPLFLALTEGHGASERGRFAVIAAVAVLVTAVVTALCGGHILAAFSLSADSMRIAGGICQDAEHSQRRSDLERRQPQAAG